MNVVVVPRHVDLFTESDRFIWGHRVALAQLYLYISSLWSLGLCRDTTWQTKRPSQDCVTNQTFRYSDLREAMFLFVFFFFGEGQRAAEDWTPAYVTPLPIHSLLVAPALYFYGPCDWIQSFYRRLVHALLLLLSFSHFSHKTDSEGMSASSLKWYLSIFQCSGRLCFCLSSANILSKPAGCSYLLCPPVWLLVLRLHLAPLCSIFITAPTV